jgi:DNA-nicking Smr family endonuclease
VLRDALPDWLAEAPHGASILAFAAGEPQRGGATYVLLRRAR